MRYFTPELCLQLNSKDGKAVDRAMAQWEKATAAYKKSLQRVLHELSAQSRRIADLSLHDWKLVMIKSGSDDKANAGGDSMLFLLEFRKHLALLSYTLTGRLRRIEAPENWHLAGNENVYWLYEELDFSESLPRSFVHRILFSDGTTLLVPFSSVEVTQIKPEHSVSHSDLKRIA
jgi:hypothetical protein